jgi:putative membrane protein
MQIFLIFSLIIAVVAVVFAVQNTAEVTVTFLAWTIKGSQAFILLMALIAGAAISFFASLPSIIRDKWTVRSHRKKLTEMEASLTVHKQKLDEAQNKLAAQEQTQQTENSEIVPTDSKTQIHG